MLNGNCLPGKLIEISNHHGSRSTELCCQDDNVKSCLDASVNIAVLQSGEDISLGEAVLSFTATVPPSGRVYTSPAGDEAVFTISQAGHLFGSLKTHDGRSYAIEKCKRGYVWVEYDVASFVEEDAAYNDSSIMKKVNH